MIIDDVLANLDYVAFVLLILCLIITIISRKVAEGKPRKPDKGDGESSKYGHLVAHKARIEEA